MKSSLGVCTGGEKGLSVPGHESVVWFLQPFVSIALESIG